MSTASVNISQALNAYQRAAGQATSSSTKTSGDSMPSASDQFGDLVKNAIAEARKIGEKDEKLSIAAINDKADITKVVTAVAEAEMTLQTVVNIRDKVLEAYNDIIRMPV